MRVIDCIVTSPPYYGLRNYGLAESIWDSKESCEHKWGETIIERVDETGYERNRKGLNKAAENLDGNERHAVNDIPILKRESSFCSVCNAWKGQLGLEPD